ncbi:histone-fold-containing protein [Linderina pennispora]|uniref:DNA polymerase epsilon subunit D n=1 Tax=Linderina pennispora TaxID=61395 RepID=A0A1Y1VSB2_9FUNG|nr:histone-fold-containing protein [Linderina pennispora]KAJ1937358.1 hypothetical protein EC988_007915 [Linderina pennispora]ORX63906.1 histone-fold-containing protein [Linderina pennispora]
MSTIEDLEFPRAVLARIIKGTMPENVSIQKEARHAVTRAATVFVSYLAATANDCAREAGHKTILANDVFKALEAVGLTDFIDKLKEDFEAHTAMAREKKEMKSKQASADGDDDNEDESDMAAATEEPKDDSMEVDEAEESSDPSKRPRLE